MEEYDLKTAELLLRKVRRKTAMGALGGWEYMFGDSSGQAQDTPHGLLRESSSNVRPATLMQHASQRES